jgi:site-specific recombinase XerC
LHAALGHLLVLLRTNAIIADPAIGLTPVDEELRRFDDHMKHVRGLASKTRKHYLSIIRRLLFWQFSDRAIVISDIKPDQVRQFVAAQSELCKVSSSISAPISALRGYFRYRSTLGDPVHHLIGVTSFPANWQQASLPKTLTQHFRCPKTVPVATKPLYPGVRGYSIFRGCSWAMARATARPEAGRACIH